MNLNQNLFNCVKNMTGYICLDSDIDEIKKSIEKDEQQLDRNLRVFLDPEKGLKIDLFEWVFYLIILVFVFIILV